MTTEILELGPLFYPNEYWEVYDKYLNGLIAEVQAQLTQDLLKSEYHEENDNNPMFGHCYVASEALYYLLSDKDRYCPARGRDPDGIVHWWLEDVAYDKIIDATSDQYYSKGKTPPYDVGKRSGFLTAEPSKRTVVVLNRINMARENNQQKD